MHSSRLYWMILGAVLVVLGASTFTFAAFSQSSSNPGNVFTTAASFCTGPVTMNVVASSDSYVSEKNGSQNFGSSPTIRVSAENKRRDRGLLHFALPSIPPRCSVMSASVYIYANSAANGHDINVFRADTAWAETSVTWLNQPSVLGVATSRASVVGWQSWDVQAQVAGMYASNNYGLVLVDAADGVSPRSGDTVFSSSEGTALNRPYLVVSFG